MEHYDHLILKGLINRGGSSIETYVYRLLTGEFSEKSESVSRMWNYLDLPLQEKLIDILQEIGGLQPRDWTNKEMVRVLIDYMAKKSGNTEFFTTNDRQAIERMSDDDYENGIADLILTKKQQLLDKE